MNIPNFMTMCRFILIPFFVWSFMGEHYLAAAIIFFAAGVTDILDGMIARRFNMTTELGKVIDPLADKLMHICAVVCLTFRYKELLWILFLLCAKEVAMIVGGFKLIKDKKEIMPSKWYGKMTTAILFIFLSLLIWLGYGEGGIPEWVCYIVFSVVALLIIYSFVRYYIEGFKGAYKRAAARSADRGEAEIPDRQE